MLLSPAKLHWCCGPLKSELGRQPKFQPCADPRPWRTLPPRYPLVAGYGSCPPLLAAPLVPIVARKPPRPLSSNAALRIHEHHLCSKGERSTKPPAC